MEITYDKEVDALNITLRSGRVAKTVEVSPEIFLDLDINDQPLYLEIIGASEKVGRKNFSKSHFVSLNLSATGRPRRRMRASGAKRYWREKKLSQSVARSGATR